MSTLGIGPSNAKIMIVGNCYSDEDTRACAPFQGAAGMELSRMLQDAGILRSECYLTNVINSQPYGGRLDSMVAYRKGDVTPDHTMLKGKYVRSPLAVGYKRLLQEIDLVKPKRHCLSGYNPNLAIDRSRIHCEVERQPPSYGLWANSSGTW